jgi:hypothetical protein
MTAARARKLLLAAGDVTERAHFDRVAFRTPRRIFATLAGDGSDVNFALDPLEQESLCEMAPTMLAPVAGGWGRMGFTRCDLKRVDEATFLSALHAAYSRASAPRTKARAATRARPERSRGRLRS